MSLLPCGGNSRFGAAFRSTQRVFDGNERLTRRLPKSDIILDGARPVTDAATTITVTPVNPLLGAEIGGESTCARS